MVTDFLHNPFVILLGGVAVFMYGLGMVSDFLQRLAANRVREVIRRVSDKNYLSIFLGVALTVLMQSSGAVTSMLVNLGSSRIITLRQVMGVIIGSAIGTTLTVQLISFNIAQYGIGIFCFSFFIYFASHQRLIRTISGMMMSFGLVFFGIELMGLGTQAFKESHLLLDIFSQMNGAPLLTIGVTAFFTAFVQSSAVTIGFAITLASSGLISLENAIYWVYGANLGTTSVALLAAIHGNNVGRQVAWAHFFYKAGGILVFIFLTPQFAALIAPLSEDVGRDIANAHTAFNVLSAILFYPAINWGADFMERLFPPRPNERAFGPEHIGPDASELPALAFEKSSREVLRMGDIVLSMIKDSASLFRGYEPELIESLRARDTHVDILHREIKMFLVRHINSGGKFEKGIFEMLSLISDLEKAADVVDKSILPLALKKQELKIDFSPQGWEEICLFHKKVHEVSSLALSCFHLGDEGLAHIVISKKREIRELERKFQESHLLRLNQGLKESINTSSIHMEILSDLRRIVGLLVGHAYHVQGVSEKSKFDVV